MAATTVIVEVTAAIVMTMVVATMIEAEMMITASTVAIGQRLIIIIITIIMIISGITGTTVIGFHGKSGSITKDGIRTTCNMVATNGTTINSILCSMTA